MQLGGLLRSIEAYSGSAVTRAALRLAPLVFLRPGELRHAEWEEFDLDAAVWTIPASKMKMRAAHLVPLSRQALQILEDIKPITGRHKWVFSGARDAKRPMSENAVTAALRNMGYDRTMMVEGEFSEEGIGSGVFSAAQELHDWNPKAPGEDWRLVWLGETEDGLAAWFVRPLAIAAMNRPTATPFRSDAA